MSRSTTTTHVLSAHYGTCMQLCALAGACVQSRVCCPSAQQVATCSGSRCCVHTAGTSDRCCGKDSLKEGVCIATLCTMWAVALAGVGADAAAVVVALGVPPARALIVVGIWAGSPCGEESTQSKGSTVPASAAAAGQSTKKNLLSHVGSCMAYRSAGCWV